MENEFLMVGVQANGTLSIFCRETEKMYYGLNYLTDQGEVGNAWRHLPPTFDRVYNSLSAVAQVCVEESGPVTSMISATYNFYVPIDYADGKSRNEAMVALPVKVCYRLNAGESFVRVELSVDNRARDHWLRANFPTGIETDETWSDSHFDVLARPIALPDSTDWVEKAGGTHPLRTFVAMDDTNDGLALMPKGIYEYEAMRDNLGTLALTLIRACRIKLAVSEEKQTELPDAGVQCPGMQHFEYAVHVYPGDWKKAGLLNEAAAYAAPVRAGQIGRGKGKLPDEMSLITMDSATVQITAIKQSEDGKALVIRLFNSLEKTQKVSLKFGRSISGASICRSDEGGGTALTHKGNVLPLSIEGKKIRTLRIALS